MAFSGINMTLAQGSLHFDNGKQSTTVQLSGDLPFHVQTSNGSLMIKSINIQSSVGSLLAAGAPLSSMNNRTKGDLGQDSAKSGYKNGSQNGSQNKSTVLAPVLEHVKPDDEDNNAEENATHATQPKATASRQDPFPTPAAKRTRAERIAPAQTFGTLAIEQYQDVIKKFPSWGAEEIKNVLQKSRLKNRLVKLPALRDFPVDNKTLHLNDNRLTGYLIQSRGTVNAHPCFSCERQAGPFSDSPCVSVFDNNLQMNKGSCGRCVWSRNYKCCSYHSDYSVDSYKKPAVRKLAVEAKKKTDAVKLRMGREVLSDDEEEEKEEEKHVEPEDEDDNEHGSEEEGSDEE